MSEGYVLIVSTALILGYIYIGVRLRQFVQPLRLEVAQVGEELLADPKTPDRVKRELRTIMNHSFSVRLAVLIVVLFPLLWLTNWKRDSGSHPLDRLDSEDRMEAVGVYRKGIICIVANTPITMLLFLIEMLIFQIVLPYRNGFTRLVTKMQSANNWLGQNRILSH